MAHFRYRAIGRDGKTMEGTVEADGLEPGQHLLLSTALHLKGTDGVTPLQHSINHRVVQGQAVQGWRRDALVFNPRQTFAHRAQGA